MNEINSLLNHTATAPTAREPAKSFEETDIDQFLGLVIAELQNQDPLNPMDNAEMMQQFTQIREIAASDRLSETLESVLIGQNFATASGLIGKQVKGLPELGTEQITGVVDRVSLEADARDNGRRTLVAYVGDQAIRMENISEVLDVSFEADTQNTTEAADPIETIPVLDPDPGQ